MLCHNVCSTYVKQFYYTFPSSGPCMITFRFFPDPSLATSLYTLYTDSVSQSNSHATIDIPRGHETIEQII